ncbi:hypothetical protein BC828DRAFT_118323 [Blastocladiella britannica]|nr:hypothetical protein BC828DRAFT_118323 [Blastocladiella britannica]
MSLGIIDGSGYIIDERNFKYAQLALDRAEQAADLAKDAQQRDMDREVEVTLRRGHAASARLLGSPRKLRGEGGDTWATTQMSYAPETTDGSQPAQQQRRKSLGEISSAASSARSLTSQQQQQQQAVDHQSAAQPTGTLPPVSPRQSSIALQAGTNFNGGTTPAPASTASAAPRLNPTGLSARYNLGGSSAAMRSTRGSAANSRNGSSSDVSPRRASIQVSSNVDRQASTSGGGNASVRIAHAPRPRSALHKATGRGGPGHNGSIRPMTAGPHSKGEHTGSTTWDDDQQELLRDPVSEFKGEYDDGFESEPDSGSETESHFSSGTSTSQQKATDTAADAAADAAAAVAPTLPPPAHAAAPTESPTKARKSKARKSKQERASASRLTFAEPSVTPASITGSAVTLGTPVTVGAASHGVSSPSLLTTSTSTDAETTTSTAGTTTTSTDAVTATAMLPCAPATTADASTGKTVSLGHMGAQTSALELRESMSQTTSPKHVTVMAQTSATELREGMAQTSTSNLVGSGVQTSAANAFSTRTVSAGVEPIPTGPAAGGSAVAAALAPPHTPTKEQTRQSSSPDVFGDMSSQVLKLHEAKLSEIAQSLCNQEHPVPASALHETRQKTSSLLRDIQGTPGHSRHPVSRAILAETYLLSARAAFGLGDMSATESATLSAMHYAVDAAGSGALLRDIVEFQHLVMESVARNSAVAAAAVVAERNASAVTAVREAPPVAAAAPRPKSAIVSAIADHIVPPRMATALSPAEKMLVGYIATLGGDIPDVLTQLESTISARQQQHLEQQQRVTPTSHGAAIDKELPKAPESDAPKMRRPRSSETITFIQPAGTTSPYAQHAALIKHGSGSKSQLLAAKPQSSSSASLRTSSGALGSGAALGATTGGSKHSLASSSRKSSTASIHRPGSHHGSHKKLSSAIVGGSTASIQSTFNTSQIIQQGSILSASPAIESVPVIAPAATSTPAITTAAAANTTSVTATDGPHAHLSELTTVQLSASTDSWAASSVGETLGSAVSNGTLLATELVDTAMAGALFELELEDTRIQNDEFEKQGAASAPALLAPTTHSATALSAHASTTMLVQPTEVVAAVPATDAFGSSGGLLLSASSATQITSVDQQQQQAESAVLNRPSFTEYLPYAPAVPPSVHASHSALGGATSAHPSHSALSEPHHAGAFTAVGAVAAMGAVGAALLISTQHQMMPEPAQFTFAGPLPMMSAQEPSMPLPAIPAPVPYPELPQMPAEQQQHSSAPIFPQTESTFPVLPAPVPFPELPPAPVAYSRSVHGSHRALDQVDARSQPTMNHFSDIAHAVPLPPSAAVSQLMSRHGSAQVLASSASREILSANANDTGRDAAAAPQAPQQAPHEIAQVTSHVASPAHVSQHSLQELRASTHELAHPTTIATHDIALPASVAASQLLVSQHELSGSADVHNQHPHHLSAANLPHQHTGTSVSVHHTTTLRDQCNGGSAIHLGPSPHEIALPASVMASQVLAVDYAPVASPGPDANRDMLSSHPQLAVAPHEIALPASTMASQLLNFSDGAAMASHHGSRAQLHTLDPHAVALPASVMASQVLSMPEIEHDSSSHDHHQLLSHPHHIALPASVAASQFFPAPEPSTTNAYHGHGHLGDHHHSHSTHRDIETTDPHGIALPASVMASQVLTQRQSPPPPSGRLEAHQIALPVSVAASQVLAPSNHASRSQLISEADPHDIALPPSFIASRVLSSQTNVSRIEPHHIALPASTMASQVLNSSSGSSAEGVQQHPPQRAVSAHNLHQQPATQLTSGSARASSHSTLSVAASAATTGGASVVALNVPLPASVVGSVVLVKSASVASVIVATDVHIGGTPARQQATSMRDLGSSDHFAAHMVPLPVSVAGSMTLSVGPVVDHQPATLQVNLAALPLPASVAASTVLLADAPPAHESQKTMSTSRSADTQSSASPGGDSESFFVALKGDNGQVDPSIIPLPMSAAVSRSLANSTENLHTKSSSAGALGAHLVPLPASVAASLAYLPPASSQSLAPAPALDPHGIALPQSTMASLANLGSSTSVAEPPQRRHISESDLLVRPPSAPQASSTATAAPHSLGESSNTAAVLALLTSRTEQTSNPYLVDPYAIALPHSVIGSQSLFTSAAPLMAETRDLPVTTNVEEEDDMHLVAQAIPLPPSTAASQILNSSVIDVTAQSADQVHEVDASSIPLPHSVAGSQMLVHDQGYHTFQTVDPTAASLSRSIAGSHVLAKNVSSAQQHSHDALRLDASTVPLPASVAGSQLLSSHHGSMALDAARSMPPSAEIQEQQAVDPTRVAHPASVAASSTFIFQQPQTDYLDSEQAAGIPLPRSVAASQTLYHASNSHLHQSHHESYLGVDPGQVPLPVSVASSQLLFSGQQPQHDQQQRQETAATTSSRLASRAASKSQLAPEPHAIPLPLSVAASRQLASAATIDLAAVDHTQIPLPASVAASQVLFVEPATTRSIPIEPTTVHPSSTEAPPSHQQHDLTIVSAIPLPASTAASLQALNHHDDGSSDVDLDAARAMPLPASVAVSCQLLCEPVSALTFVTSDPLSHGQSSADVHASPPSTRGYDDETAAAATSLPLSVAASQTLFSPLLQSTTTTRAVDIGFGVAPPTKAASNSMLAPESLPLPQSVAASQVLAAHNLNDALSVASAAPLPASVASSQLLFSQNRSLGDLNGGRFGGDTLAGSILEPHHLVPLPLSAGPSVDLMYASSDTAFIPTAAAAPQSPVLKQGSSQHFAALVALPASVAASQTLASASSLSASLSMAPERAVTRELPGQFVQGRDSDDFLQGYAAGIELPASVAGSRTLLSHATSVSSVYGNVAHGAERSITAPRDLSMVPSERSLDAAHIPLPVSVAASALVLGSSESVSSMDATQVPLPASVAGSLATLLPATSLASMVPTRPPGGSVSPSRPGSASKSSPRAKGVSKENASSRTVSMTNGSEAVTRHVKGESMESLISAARMAPLPASAMPSLLALDVRDAHQVPLPASIASSLQNLGGPERPEGAGESRPGSAGRKNKSSVRHPTHSTLGSRSGSAASLRGSQRQLASSSSKAAGGQYKLASSSSGAGTVPKRESDKHVSSTSRTPSVANLAAESKVNQ